MSDQDSGEGGKRRRIDSVIPELIKRAVERGVEKATEAPSDIKSFVQDRRLPKEIAHYLYAQVDETKNGLFRVVAKEMRDFLEHTNIAGEMQKVLTTVQFEINTTIRFSPNDGKGRATEDEGEGASLEGEREREGADAMRPPPPPKPEVKTQVHVRELRESRRERRRAQKRGD